MARVGREMTRVVLLERQMARFLRKPVSVRSAASVIVSSTAVIVLASGALMRVLDHREYPNIFIGMWWAIQTVTTVGYGDVTPKSVAGRIVAGIVMLEGIAFVAIVTAAVTSTFVARATRQRDIAEAKDENERDANIESNLAEMNRRLDRVETMLHNLTESQSGR